MDGRELSELGRRLQQLGSQAGPDVGVEDVVAAAVGGDDPRAIAEAVAVLDVLA